MNILNLPAWSVLDTREADHDYHITVQLSYPPSHCPHCGVVANLQGYGGKEQLFLDLELYLHFLPYHLIWILNEMFV